MDQDLRMNWSTLGSQNGCRRLAVDREMLIRCALAQSFIAEQQQYGTSLPTCARDAGFGATAAAAAAALQAARSSTNTGRYKTELCRPFEETGHCKYGDKCQFAHGDGELRSLTRHPKYKTELCRTFHTTGFCPYGPRCHFMHCNERNTTKKSSAASEPSFSARRMSMPSRMYGRSGGGLSALASGGVSSHLPLEGPLSVPNAPAVFVGGLSVDTLAAPGCRSSPQTASRVRRSRCDVAESTISRIPSIQDDGGLLALRLWLIERLNSVVASENLESGRPLPRHLPCSMATCDADGATAAQQLMMGNLVSQFQQLLYSQSNP